MKKKQKAVLFYKTPCSVIWIIHCNVGLKCFLFT